MSSGISILFQVWRMVNFFGCILKRKKNFWSFDIRTVLAFQKHWQNLMLQILSCSLRVLIIFWITSISWPLTNSRKNSRRIFRHFLVIVKWSLLLHWPLHEQGWHKLYKVNSLCLLLELSFGWPWYLGSLDGSLVWRRPHPASDNLQCYLFPKWAFSAAAEEKELE